MCPKIYETELFTFPLRLREESGVGGHCRSISINWLKHHQLSSSPSKHWFTTKYTPVFDFCHMKMQMTTWHFMQSKFAWNLEKQLKNPYRWWRQCIRKLLCHQPQFLSGTTHSSIEWELVKINNTHGNLQCQELIKILPSSRLLWIRPMFKYQANRRWVENTKNYFIQSLLKLSTWEVCGHSNIAKTWTIYHNNALSHILAVREFLAQKHISTLPHPSYSPELALWDFCVPQNQNSSEIWKDTILILLKMFSRLPWGFEQSLMGRFPALL